MKPPTRRTKPRAKPSEEKAGFGRRTPPPDRTGLEQAYFSECLGCGAEVAVTLRDGRTLQGTVAEFDRDMLTLQVTGASAVVLRKSDIRYVSAEEK